ncbi:MAG: hypothetical protein KAT65_07980 [Methanophagales archaeon]|nr:hypothetical protein [Methanophagales archaeon]
MKREILFSKVDMDTCLTAFILGVSDADEVIAIREEAEEKYLNDPGVICIEIGGSGTPHLNNFDHHNFEGEIGTACEQAYHKKETEGEALKRLVDYVSAVDMNPKSLLPKDFPTLSDVFSGMLLTYKDPKEELFKGMEIFQVVLDKKLDPFDTMPSLPEWAGYIKAKRKNDLEVKEAVKKAYFVSSKSGLKIGYVKATVFGVIGELYDLGCDIVVAYNPEYGMPQVRKFTIAGKEIHVEHLVTYFNELESGWGGRKTIIGSPRKGSTLSLEEVVEIVKEKI